MELHMEAGACASVKIIPCFENFSTFGFLEFCRWLGSRYEAYL